MLIKHLKNEIFKIFGTVLSDCRITFPPNNSFLVREKKIKFKRYQRIDWTVEKLRRYRPKADLEIGYQI